MKNTKSNKLFWKLILIAIVMILVVLALTICAIIVIHSKYPSPATNDAWLSYFGSIIGASIGAITSALILGVKLDKDSEKRKQDEIDKIKPYLYIKNCNIFDSKKVEETTISYIAFKIINLGLGPAFDIEMKHINNESKIELTSNLSEQDSSVHMIQEKLTFSVHIELENASVNETFEITYYDMYKNKYSQTVEMNFTSKSSKCSHPT